MKKLLQLSLACGFLFLLQTAVASAATPTMSLSNTEGDNVQVDVRGDATSGVLLFYQNSSGASYLRSIGTTNTSGSFSTTISTASYDILPGSSVYVKVNNQQSTTMAWPYSVTTNGGAITLSKTGLILSVGNNASLTVNNVGSSKLYLLNNSNPQIANINLSGNQATIYANTYGQTVATICVLGTTSNCASTYVTVQNSGAKELTLSQSNLTIAYGQSSQVLILNSTGNYTILNNSNPNVITASLNNQTITLTASNNGGSAAITVCSNDMSACGIINATVGTLSSASLTFNQPTPSLSLGQSLIVAISGGGTNYNISSNSNSNIVGASISGNSLTLSGVSAGSSVITICSSTGNCNSLTATVSYSSTGGPITLSQSNLWLQIGQAVSVVISGGTSPYSFVNDTNSNSLFQTSLNNNILTLTGLKAGSAAVSVCSAGGACTQLSVLVNGVSSTTQLTFGSNNLSLKAGASSDVSLYGAGGYFISNSTNQNVAAITISDSKAVVTALTAGSASATVCQTGGQCGVIYVAVTSTESNAPVAFSLNSPTISVGQSLVVPITGDSSRTYTISSNSNPAIAQVNLNGNSLVLLGKVNGSTVVTVCAALNNCNSLAVTVGTGSVNNDNNTNNQTGADNSQSLVTEAKLFFQNNLSEILKNAGALKNVKLEATVKTKNLNPLVSAYKLTANQINSLNQFLTYGSLSTLKMSAAERASYLASYIWAYGQVPKTETQWVDLINIASGNEPVNHSVKAETQAKAEFKKVYDRAADMNKGADKKAIMFIAYGLKPGTRNTANEAKAIKVFRATYSHAPISTLAWNIVRAITYSGVID